MELDVAVPGGALRRHGEHIRAAVHADDRALVPDRLEQLGDVEARAAAHVKDAVAGSYVEGSSHRLASAQHVARRIQPLQPFDETLIELQLAHCAVPFHVRGGCPVTHHGNSRGSRSDAERVQMVWRSSSVVYGAFVPCRPRSMKRIIQSKLWSGSASHWKPREASSMVNPWMVLRTVRMAWSISS